MLKRVFILTRTLYSEPPRIRHQVSHMFNNMGYEVYFFERPKQYIPMRNRQAKLKSEGGIKIITWHELLHHQLKPYKWMVKLCSLFAVNQIKSLNIQPDIIINFNYDLINLESSFPNSNVITIINDDFYAQSKWWMKSAVNDCLEIIRHSPSLTFAVSNSLVEQTNGQLLLPWADSIYEKPNRDTERNVLLYYGFINNRIDWLVVEGLLANKYIVRFVGPVNQSEASIKIKELIGEFSNFEYQEATDINELYVDDVIASIAPYDLNYSSVKACQLSNRAFRLLAKGIPTIYSDLPLVESIPDFGICTAKGLTDFLFYIDYYLLNFHNLQENFEVYVSDNSEEARYLNIIDSLKVDS